MFDAVHKHSWWKPDNVFGYGDFYRSGISKSETVLVKQTVTMNIILSSNAVYSIIII